MIDYSPIIIPVYDRLDHLKSCLSALAVNPLAIHSELFIYMDHPKDELTMHIQDKIHDCIMTFLASFKNLQIIRRNTNLGPKENILSAIKSTLMENENLIFIEDDCIVHNSFLKFMNSSLYKFKNDKKVTGVSGYLFPSEIIQSSTQTENIDYTLLPYCSGFGMGLWKSKFFYPEISWKQLIRYARNKSFIEKINHFSSRHYYVILKDIIMRNDRWGDFCTMLNNIELDNYWVFPTQTLVKNNGADGSGVHQGKFNASKFFNQMLPLSNDLSFNFEIQSAETNNYRKSIKKYFFLGLKARLLFPIFKFYFLLKYGQKK